MFVIIARCRLDLRLQAGDGSTLDNGVAIGNCTAPSDAAPIEAESVTPEFAESVKPEFNGASESRFPKRAACSSSSRFPKRAACSSSHR